jgi:hypothetical protein
MTETQAAATRFCARVIGPLLVIIGAIVIVRLGDLVLLVPAILQDGALAFITGIFALIVGLILFSAHHHWSSPAAIVVSLIGVLTIVRGLLLMLAPTMLSGLAAQMTNAGPGVMIVAALALLLGVWLSFVGWFAKHPA